MDCVTVRNHLSNGESVAAPPPLPARLLDQCPPGLLPVKRFVVRLSSASRSVFLPDLHTCPTVSFWPRVEAAAGSCPVGVARIGDTTRLACGRQPDHW
jgi:hypothetical protein